MNQREVEEMRLLLGLLHKILPKAVRGKVIRNLDVERESGKEDLMRVRASVELDLSVPHDFFWQEANRLLPKYLAEGGRPDVY